MGSLLFISGLLALIACMIGWRFVHQVKRKRIVSSLLWSTQGVLVFSISILVLLVYSNLHTYQRLTYEAHIADVHVTQLEARKYQLSVSSSEQDKTRLYYILQGDQWQLDARILKWKGWANLIGLDSYYQLDRLSGRYEDVEQARLMLPTIHDLTPESRGIDLWKLKKMYQAKLGFVDTLFGQGIFMPMIDGAHFRVSIGQSGLLVRPVNDVAKASIL
ncbi:MAG: hypothetical protein GY744_02995 [Gammaproteobacteria bacterium]|nr:hypothetical protein [Gammaproteobacteria bacterium]